MAKEVYWHLPGFCVHFYLNQVFINLMKEEPYRFRDGYKIGSVYGTFPGAIWNGGRAVFGVMSINDMEKIIKTYNGFDIPVRFTWTNSLLEEKHLNDTYCNLIMDLANNGKNQVLCNKEVLEDYLRKEYPNFGFISSTTKRITDLTLLKEEIDKGYELVVLDYDLNHDEEVLEKLAPVADKIEILVDEVCSPKCPRRLEHYKDESLMQLTYNKDKRFVCPFRKEKPSLSQAMERPQFIGSDDISAYVDKGFNNFKIVGRGLPFDMVFDSYIYYLVKDEEQAYVRSKVQKILQKLTGK